MVAYASFCGKLAFVQKWSKRLLPCTKGPGRGSEPERQFIDFVPEQFYKWRRSRASSPALFVHPRQSDLGGHGRISTGTDTRPAAEPRQHVQLEQAEVQTRLVSSAICQWVMKLQEIPDRSPYDSGLHFRYWLRPQYCQPLFSHLACIRVRDAESRFKRS